MKPPIRAGKDVMIPPGRSIVLIFPVPEDEDSAVRAINADDWAWAMADVAEQLRSWIEYGHEFKTADEALEAAKRVVFESLEDRGLSLDDAL